MDLLFPDVRTQKLAPRLIDNTARFSSPFTQASRSISRGGDRWGFAVTMNDLAGLDRARVESLIANMRGAANRVLFTPSEFTQRGSFPAGEKLINNNFATGTNGWTAAAGGTLSVSDRRARYTFNGAGLPQLYQSVSNMTANLPHVARYFLVDGRGTPLLLSVLASYIQGPTVSANATSFEGLNILALVPDGVSGNQFPVISAGPMIPTGQIAGNYVEAVWTSLSQCMLVDNGPNLVLNSDDFSAGSWSAVSCSVTVNALTDPTGLATGDVLVESGASAEHTVTQTATVTATVLDYCAAVALKADGRNFAGLGIYESTGSSVARGDFNVSTGALLGTATGGGNWANVRQFSVPLGNGWYYCAVVARKLSAATTIALRIYAESAGGTVNYAGSSAAAIGMFRGTLAQSSVPMRLAPTAGSNFPSGILQTGGAISVKGLPASTNGLLLVDDWFEVNKELKKIIAQLNSDGAGCGYLQFSPPIRNSPADNDPVIVNMPMGRFIFSASENGWEASPGGLIGPRATYTLDLVEAA